MIERNKLDSLSLIALVSAYNQAGRLGRTLSILASLGVFHRILVVDDASRDASAAEAEASGAEVLVLPRNVGKGGALNAAYGRVERCDVLVLVDGDLAEAASEVTKLIEPVLSGRLDLAIADFPKADRKGGLGLAKGAARRGIRKLTGWEAGEPLSGQRAMTWAVAEKVFPVDAEFGVEVGMTIDALRAGFKVGEIETAMSHAETGRDLGSWIHRGKQWRDVRKALWRRGGRPGEDEEMRELVRAR